MRHKLVHDLNTGEWFVGNSGHARELGVFEALFKALNSVSVDLYRDRGDATAETLNAGLVHQHKEKINVSFYRETYGL
jgi:hypothetical protein